MGKININIQGKKETHKTRDLYGVFFEDINHAADGGLYAELIRNRSFEYSEIDNKEYNSFTGWEITKNSVGDIYIEDKEPYSSKNPHYVVFDNKDSDNNEEMKITNKGFNSGIFLENGKKYYLSFLAKSDEETDEVVFSIEENEIVYEKAFSIDRKWKKYEEEVLIDISKESIEAKLNVLYRRNSKIFIDFVSLFPEDTYKKRRNGLRKDLANAIEDLKPKFFRFPGGCLVHDGSLDKDARDSLYRWKNTIGPLEERPARKNNWGYNQTLGLGYYEYFLFCEDINAKPIPVLPAAYNPHRMEAVPIEHLKEWIDDALDLIEFANGDISTPWGQIRKNLGHSEPFNLEYIAIGNEELFEPFIERYPYFHNAIKEKYPEIKVISSSGPFADGYDFSYMWDEANKAGADIVDEHYYMSPEWMIKHVDRYDNYDSKRAKVFLGEYASLDNKYKNALYEAAFMTGIENNCDKIALACYAPLLANKDYVNWKPDLIWFDNKNVLKTANYYVQKMFMEDIGDCLTSYSIEGIENEFIKIPDIKGRFGFESINESITFRKITLNGKEIASNMNLYYNPINKEIIVDNENFEVVLLEDGVKKAILYKEKLETNSVIEYEFIKNEGKAQLKCIFGYDNNEYYCWEMGGWANDMSNLSKCVNKKFGGLNIGSYLKIEENVLYNAKLSLEGRKIEARLNDKIYQEFEEKETNIKSLYSTISQNEDSIIIKLVNVKDDSVELKISLDEDNYDKVRIDTIIADTLISENTFEKPFEIITKSEPLHITKDNRIEVEIKSRSVNKIVIKK